MSASAFRLPRLPDRPLLDVRLGLALLRDGRVPLRYKAASLALGLAITGVLEVMELPLEGLLAAILPVFGLAGDLVMDGAEVVAGPLLLSTVLLPHLAPRRLVGQIHAERATRAPRGPIIDV